MQQSVNILQYCEMMMAFFSVQYVNLKLKLSKHYFKVQRDRLILLAYNHLWHLKIRHFMLLGWAKLPTVSKRSLFHINHEYIQSFQQQCVIFMSVLSSWFLVSSRYKHTAFWILQIKNKLEPWSMVHIFPQKQNTQICTQLTGSLRHGYGVYTKIDRYSFDHKQDIDQIMI